MNDALYVDREEFDKNPFAYCVPRVEVIIEQITNSLKRQGINYRERVSLTIQRGILEEILSELKSLEQYHTSQ